MARILQQRNLRAFGAVRNETTHLEEVALQTLLGRRALTPIPAQQPPEQLLQLVVQLILLQFIQSAVTHFARFVSQGLKAVRVLVHRFCNDAMIPLSLTQRHDPNPQEEPTVAVATNSGSQVKVVHLLSLLRIIQSTFSHDQQRNGRVAEQPTNQVQLVQFIPPPKQRNASADLVLHSIPTPTLTRTHATLHKSMDDVYGRPRITSGAR